VGLSKVKDNPPISNLPTVCTDLLNSLTSKNQTNSLHMATYQLIVNGENREVEAVPNTPLLWVLRDNLSLTGTKYGCGMAQCGACTVHLDGTAVRSCSTPVSTIGNKKVTTIEGISSDSEVHPVQQAWMDENVPQCGYCQTGQIMSAVALLKKNPTPNDRDIETAMSGNICRCGTYERIRKAIKRASNTSAK
jgi:isoquinoline 1-oxidoreductase subunit alpha